MSSEIATTLTVDVAQAPTRDALHQLLAEAFHFPDYYGRNWDAFEDCIRDVVLPAQVTIRGLGALRARLPREAELLSQCILEFAAEEPGTRVILLDA